jgi:hypothetical protein
MKMQLLIIADALALSSYEYEFWVFLYFWWSLFKNLVMDTNLDIYVLITSTGSIPLLVDYYSPRLSLTRLDTSAGGLLFSEVITDKARYLCWWTIILRGYHWQGSIPLLVDYYSPRLSLTRLDTSAGGLLFPEGITDKARYLCWWTIILRGYHWQGSIPRLVDYFSPRVLLKRLIYFKIRNLK